MTSFVITTINPAGGPGPQLRYDTSDSSLVNAHTGEPVVPRSVVEGSVNALAVCRGTPIGKTSPSVLKISLGLSCNYECEYCSQRFVARADETNPDDGAAFLAGLDEWVKTPPERIEFWGGEPFVYIKTMKPLAEALRRKYPTAGFYVTTNGSLLSTELNQWLDDLGFSVALSHDGPGQSTRGPDPLKDPEKKAAILDLWARLGPKHRMSFNAMVHKNNQSRHHIQEFFRALTGEKNVPIGEGGFVDAYDEGGIANSLSHEDMADFRRYTFEEIRRGMASGFVSISDKITGFVRTVQTGRAAGSLGQKCGMDREDNIAVDLRGNVLTCQNVSAASVAPNGESNKIGTVADLAGAKLKTSTHWSHRSECPNCPVLHICKGSCMFLEGELWDRSCDNAFSDAIPVFAAAIEFMTGCIPVHIEGPQREDRKDIWNPPAPKQRVIPIKQV